MMEKEISLFKRYRIPFLAVIFLTTAMLTISYRINNVERLAFIDWLILEITVPFQKAIMYSTDALGDLIDSYILLVDLKRENVALRRMMAELQQENSSLREKAIGSERLRNLLGFSKKITRPMLPVQIIGIDPSSWFRTIVIDKGTQHGVKRGMPAVSPEGIVGHVLQTSPHCAKVLLITDFNSSVDAIVQRSRAKGVVEGNGENLCSLKYAPRTHDIQQGDRVVTSGLGGRYPKGLMIGKISKIEKKSYGLFQKAEIIPSVNFTKLEEVFVITETYPIEIP
ncbi:MAG: rod shape-determining protein MreC [Syntrophobacterales bacterium]|nr:MAG: rod shape-determining protein MreC [Syntrophobacterales bacterium]